MTSVRRALCASKHLIRPKEQLQGDVLQVGSGVLSYPFGMGGSSSTEKLTWVLMLGS